MPAAHSSPVPCISKVATSAAARLASLRARRITCRQNNGHMDVGTSAEASRVDELAVGMQPDAIHAVHPLACCWLGPLGAVRLLLRPSWFTAAPATTAAYGRAPSLALKPSRLRELRPRVMQASPRT